MKVSRAREDARGEILQNDANFEPRSQNWIPKETRALTRKGMNRSSLQAGIALETSVPWHERLKSVEANFTGYKTCSQRANPAP